MKSIGGVLLVVAALFLSVPVLQAQSAKVLVPDTSWDCGMPAGIPNPESGMLIFEAEMKLDRIANIGKTPYGERQAAVVQDGTLAGTKVSGTIMPGALDLQLKLSNGALEIEQFFVFKTSDGKYAYVHAAGTGPDANDVRVVMDFEAPNAGTFAWLNSGKYVARRVLNADAKTMTMQVYDVSGVASAIDSSHTIRISKPAGVPNQPWNYRKADAGEKQGEVLITETVTLSPSQLVGPSKRGTRNIIPITGGELTGRIPGKVLFGGADYQNLSGPPAIDARYLWQAANGDIIIVRNTGSGALVPTFEIRTDSPYAFLNSGKFLSSAPGRANGGVGITMYESAR